jgi:transposase
LHPSIRNRLSMETSTPLASLAVRLSCPIIKSANRAEVLPTPPMRFNCAHDSPYRRIGRRLRRLDDRVDAVTSEVHALARQDECCRRLTSVPGIGALTASAVLATIGNGAAFSKGRDFGAWLGLEPKQLSTGDRTILGRLSKRGNKYGRTLFIGARAVLAKPGSWAKFGLQGWLAAAAKRLHTITSRLRRLPTNSRALHGACSITAVHSRETSSHSPFRARAYASL